MGNFISAIFSSVGSVVKTWLIGRQEKQAAKNKRELARINNQARLLEQTETNNAAWEMEALTDRDRGLEWVSYVILAAPFIIGFFSPSYLQRYFAAIRDIPQWWVVIFVSVNGAVWGIARLKNVIPQMGANFISMLRR